MQFIEATAIQDKDGNFQIEMPEDMDLSQVMFLVVMDEDDEDDEDFEDSSDEDPQIYAMRASELFAILSGEDDDDNEIIPTASGVES